MLSKNFKYIGKRIFLASGKKRISDKKARQAQGAESKS
jgi:hypothetical protein